MAKEKELFADLVSDEPNPNDERLDMGSFDDYKDEDAVIPGKHVGNEIQDNNAYSEENPNKEDPIIEEDIFGFNEDEYSIDVEEDPIVPDGVDIDDQEEEEESNVDDNVKKPDVPPLTDETTNKSIDDKYALPKERQELYDKNKDIIDYFVDHRKKSDDKIVFSHLRQKHKLNHGDSFTEEDRQDIEDRIETYRTAGTLELMADNVRDKIDATITKLSEVNNSIENQRNTLNESRNQEYKTKLESSLKGFMSNKFYGIKVDVAKAKEAYQDVVTGKFFKEVENDTELTAEFALFRKYKDILLSKSNGADYSAGVKDVMDELSGGKKDVRHVQARSQVRSGSGGDLRSRFTKD